jgi:hypothetical protein
MLEHVDVKLIVVCGDGVAFLPSSFLSFIIDAGALPSALYFIFYMTALVANVVGV